MNYGFQNKSLLTTSRDGWHFDLQEWLVFHDDKGNRYRTKTPTDGGSTPWWLWWLIPPFGKRDWWSFIQHDGCFKNLIEIWDFQHSKWVKWNPTEGQSNRLLYCALTSQGYGRFKKLCVFIALEVFGWKAYDDDRKRATK